MRLSRLLPAAFALSTLLAVSGAASAQGAEETARIHSVNISPIGALVGAYHINYERLQGAHGILIEGSVARTKGDDAEASSAGIGLGYRWHWRGEQSSGFLGFTLGYSVGVADAEIGDEPIAVNTRALTATGNIGKRWAWDNGLNITLRIGAGLGHLELDTDERGAAATMAVDAVSDLLERLPVVLDGELSVGYVF